MPQKPARLAASDRRRQILAVAVKLFARRGFRGTTTRQIAERAGVNEAILFRHFPRKEDLYWAVLDGKCRSFGGRRQLEAELRVASGQTNGSLRRDKQLFAAIAEGMLRRNTEDTTLSRLLLFSALNDHRLSHRFFRTHVASYYEVLALYIRRRIRAGAFRRVDPLLAARGFLGMVVYHFLIQELFGGRRFQKFETRHVCETLSDIWVEGMRGSRHAAGRKRSTRRGLPATAGDFSVRRASVQG